MGSSKINWPDDLRPENSPVYTYNELAIPVDPRMMRAWLIRAQGSGCKVITEETQKGLTAGLTRSATQREILHRHQTWLEGLAKMSPSGLPD
jgi:hypothetical protein